MVSQSDPGTLSTEPTEYVGCAPSAQAASAEAEEQIKIRIGIDVGGTFTHAVAINAATLAIIGRAKVPTTHRAAEGVARGIIEALQAVLTENGIAPASVGFIAHSTTQATNALLEGDVAAVGILGMGGGANAWLASLSTKLGKIELAPNKFLPTFHRFINTTKRPDDATIRSALQELVAAGAKALAISEAFSVDAPENEERALSIAREMGLLATSGCEVSQLYGLKVRTRTAVINASMLPKMLESAEMTERSVREAGITAPVMIMRSDGGVMDIDAMRRKPILTMLSGPAAGVAAAMMFLHISDGVFLEVGGTSTDISAISNGRAQVRPGQVGGHKVYMHTLDVRTVGVAGGSMPRMSESRLIDIGPRSAHIAGLSYVSFTDQKGTAAVKTIQPRPEDPADYLAIAEGSDTPNLCLTPTCASNLLGLVPQEDCAKGNMEHIQAAFAALGKRLNTSATDLAESMLTMAANKCMPIVRSLVKDYKLDPQLVALVGGGGGAAAIVPFVAKQMKMQHQLAQHADIISAIGVALALIRETVERQIMDPSNEDILKVREEAQSAVVRMGADPATVDIHVEVDARTNTVRATAFGATSLTTATEAKRRLTEEERLSLLAESMRVEAAQVARVAETEFFQAYSAQYEESKLLGLLRTKINRVRVLDAAGNMRLQSNNAVARSAMANKVEGEMVSMIDEFALWGDAGKVIPNLVMLVGPKIVDLSGLLNSDQILALAKIELEAVRKETPVILVAKLS